MSFSMYHHGTSCIHKLSAGQKLAILAGLGTAISFSSSLPVLVGSTAVCLGAYYMAKLSWREFYAQLRPLFWIIVILFTVKFFTDNATEAAVMVLRLCVLVASASLVTLTTTTEAMLEALECLLQPLARFGVSPVKVAFALSLVIRFIPIVGQMSNEVREAQQARGLGSNILALTIPLVIRIVKMADHVAEAIEARGGLPENNVPNEEDFVAIPLNTSATRNHSLSISGIQKNS